MPATVPVISKTSIQIQRSVNMIRIIAGELKGRKIFLPRGKTKIRPTSGKVREAIFSILREKIPGSVVCDLYAGTGALGIEAISRGARFCVFVEADRSAVGRLQNNIDLCGISSRTRVIKWDIEAGLQCLARLGLRYDIVFADPPYKGADITGLLAHLQDSRSLAGGALIVLEHAAKAIPEPLPPGFQVKDQRRYGKTFLTFLSFSET